MIGRKTIVSKGFCRQAVFAFVFIATLVYAARPSVSDDFTDRRITAGAKIFRAMLAADVDIAGKVGKNGELRLCLLYVDDAGNAEKAAATLGKRDDSRIRDKEVRVEVLPYRECVGGKGGRFAGIFLTQHLSAAELENLIDFANRQKMIVFSPFEGDVERGVQGGIAVEARVRPYLNVGALRAADIRLKSFFLRVAKHYEE